MTCYVDCTYFFVKVLFMQGLGWRGGSTIRVLYTHPVITCRIAHGGKVSCFLIYNMALNGNLRHKELAQLLVLRWIVIACMIISQDRRMIPYLFP